MDTMPHMPMEHDAVVTAVALCALIAGSMGMLIGSAAQNARHTVAGTALAVLALGWGLLFWTGDALRAGIVLADQGISLALAGLGALVSIMAVADRSRVAGGVLFALAVSMVAMRYIYPLLEDTLPLQSLATSLYNVIVLSAAAGFALLCGMSRSGVRFTAQGDYRVAPLAAFSKEAWIGGLLALGITLLTLRMRSTEGVDVEPLMYASITGAVAAAFGAAAMAMIRRMPFAISHAFLALPAGVLAIGLLNDAGAVEVCVLAAMAGMLSSLCREALVRARLDEPSQNIACLCIPAMLGMMAPAWFDNALIVSQAAWVGALIASGLTLGYAARLFAQATLGLALSRRAREEGPDKRYAMQGA